jgi:hypothetical protein
MRCSRRLTILVLLLLSLDNCLRHFGKFVPETWLLRRHHDGGQKNKEGSKEHILLHYNYQDAKIILRSDYATSECSIESQRVIYRNEEGVLVMISTVNHHHLEF